MSWRWARSLSATLYAEVAFQAIYGLRSGNILSEKTPPSVVVALTRVRQSKVLISFLLALVALAVPALLGGTVEHVAAPQLPVGLYRSSVLAALLVIDLALVWWTGLQVLPTLLGAKVQSLLETLPIDERTLDRTALLTTLRLFDAPIVTVLVITPFVVGLAFGSVWAALAILPGAAMVLLVAIGLSLATGRFYVQRVVGSGGGRSASALRWAYLVLWTLPAFALFGFVTFSPQFFTELDTLYVGGQLGPLTALLSTFPFPLAELPLYTPGQSPPEVSAIPILALAGVYLALMVPLALWLRTAPRALARAVTTNSGTTPEYVGRLQSRSIVRAVLEKDLRTASRTPGFAFLLLLPILDAVAIGLWSFLGHPTAGNVLTIGAAAVGSSALLATFFAPAFFAIEVFGFSYTRSLPLPREDLLAGKIALVLAIFLTSSGIVLGLAAAAIPTAYVVVSFAFFALAELPAILAAALFEFTILFRRAAHTGLPITSLYAGAGWVLAVSIPGLFIAGAPLVSFEYLRNGAHLGNALLPVMAILALLELAVITPLALKVLGRGSL
jgi:predicted permease